MSLHQDDNKPKAQTQQPQPLDVARQQQRQSRQDESRHGQRSLPRAIGRSAAGESVMDFTKAFQRIFESAKVTGVDYSVIPMDGNALNAYYSMVGVVATTAIGAKRIGALFVYILEGSNVRPAPAMVSIGRASVEHIPTAMAAWRSDVAEDVLEYVRQQTGEETIYLAGATTVSDQVRTDDENAIYELLWIASEATVNVFEVQAPDQFPPFKVSEHVATNNNMVVTAEYNAGHALDANKRPVRSDIRLTLSVNSGDSKFKDVQDSWQRRGSRNLMEVNAHVEPVYIGQPATNQFGQPVSSQLFQPVLWVNRVLPADGIRYTHESWLLGVGTTVLLGDNMAWGSTFSNFGTGSIHDVGGVGARIINQDGTQGGLIDTSSNMFQDEALAKVLHATMLPTLVHGVIVDHVGPDSWLTGSLSEAARGDVKANQFWINVANNLTDGHFARIYTGEQVCVLQATVHTGTFIDRDRNVRDLREIDSLALINILGVENMAVVDAWEATFLNTGIPEEMRLAERVEILRNSLSAHNVNITGTADMIVFSQAFMDCLVSAISQAGLAVEPNGIRPIFGREVRAGNSQISSYAMSSGMGAGLVRQTNNRFNYQARNPFVGGGRGW